jgi:hypothetical protein
MMTATALGNVLRRLRRRGLDLTPLTEPDLAAGTGREEWRGWRAGPVLHIALRLVAPGAVPLQRLLVAAGDADLSAAVRADGDRVAGVLRVTADATAHRLLAVAPGLGLHLERLDGRHGPAIAATLPLGGELP